MVDIHLPISEKDARKLKIGDEVSLYGTIITARDAAHKLMVEKWPDFLNSILKDGAIYHCGPVMKKKNEKWKAVAAGPTTSIREEPYEADVMKHYGVRFIIGKGGMGEKTLEACKNVGAVYLHAVGGAALLLADTVTNVKAVHMLTELGVPEAFWEFEVKDFKGVVTMDSHGNSLHKNLFEETKKKRDKLIGV